MGDNPLRHRWSPWLVRLTDCARRFRVGTIGRWWGFACLVLVLTWLMGLTIGSIPEQLQEGMIAPYDVRADREYRILDVAATNAAREEAMKGVLPVYDFYTGMGSATAERLRKAFEATRQAYGEYLRERSSAVGGKGAGRTSLGRGGVPSAWTPQARELGIRRAIDRVMVSALYRTWEEQGGVPLTDAQWRALIEEEWSIVTQEAIVGQVLRVMSRPIVAEVESLSAQQERGLTLRKMVVPDTAQQAVETVWKGKTVAEVWSLEMARKSVRGKGMKERLRNPRNAEVIAGIAAAAIQPNCAPSLVESELRRAQAVKDVPERPRLVQAGEVIVRRGEAYTAEDVMILEGIRRQKATGTLPLKFAGNYLFVAAFLLLMHRFGRRYIRKYAPRQMDLLFQGGFLLLMMACVRAGGILSEILADALPFPIPRFAYYYFIPLGAGGMLVRFLLNSETALLFAVCLAVFSGLLVPQDPSFTAFALATTVAGAFAIAHADKRSAIIRAGILTGGVSAVAAVGIHLMRAGALGELLTVTRLCWYAGTAFAGGIFSAIFVLALTPVAESLCGYTTDIKLLELANLNHPLLRELIIRAPGTYHHSHLVGILAEAAAQAVGANPLLARVGAYYHDIGKVRKPLYFTENLKDGESRHERLTPHMSALIIGSHIKDGLELARTYKLPERIAALIPQHHGTNLIGYFYERAKAAANPALGAVDEKDYRYPGPKPQSREAGILMLADQSEGAVRALKEKSPARIQQTVEQIMNKTFAEGQLDECELTLKNLYDISNAFARILLGIYHQRVEYPRETLQLHEKAVPLLEPSATREHSTPGPPSKRPVPTTHH